MKTTLKMMTTTIKTLLFLWVMSLTFSCSNNKKNSPSTDATAQNAAISEKSADTITINGIVKTVNFGKDGYTAEVQTDTQGIYAALVSIVNVGGRENYKSCGVGDTVIFKGVPSVLGDVKQLKVTEVINIVAVQAQVLEAQYQKIKPNDYCWQINKVMKLHTQPSADSKVEGEHFAGETLKVLGTKMINNQLWVNVRYHLKIKAGYEDQFADGQVMSSGSPTGWMGGAEIPKINCK